MPRRDGSDWADTPELWELQTGPHLTVGQLLSSLSRVDPSLEVEVFVSGCGHRGSLYPVEIGAVGRGDRQPRIVITAASLDRLAEE